MLRARAVAAFAGQHPQTGVSEMTPVLRVGMERIERWTPSFETSFKVRFRLDSRTGYAHDLDGQGTLRARWRHVDGPHADLTLHTDGVSAYLLEEADPSSLGFLYQLSEQDRHQLAAMQSEVDEWFERGALVDDVATLLASYLDDREAWLRLAAYPVRSAIQAAFDAEIDETGRRPIRLVAAVAEYLAAAYLQLPPTKRETVHVLIEDGLPLLAALDTARAL
jgi:hypothetical protein